MPCATCEHTPNHNHDDLAMLSAAALCELLDISRVSLWAWRRDGRFPAPVRLGPNRIAWRKADVAEWLAARERA